MKESCVETSTTERHSVLITFYTTTVMEAATAADEDTYIVSVEETTIVYDEAEILNDVLIAHVIEDGVFDVITDEESIHQDETAYFQLAQPCPSKDNRPSALYTAISEKNWEEASELMDFDEKETFFKYAENWNGWTALHKACFEISIPIELFRDLVSFSLELHGEKLITDKWGDTALHLACQHSTDEMILILLDNFPSAATVQNKHGGLPLHVAVHFECPSAIIRELLRINPESVHIANNYDNSPLQSFLHSEKFIYPPSNPSPDSLPLYGGDHDEVCNILRLLLRPKEEKKIEKSITEFNPFLILHASLYANAPLDFITLILSRYPEEISMEDEEGNMPIHIAVTLKDETYRHDILRTLISAYPQIIKVPNRYGRLPLSIASECNLTTNDLLETFCTSVSTTMDTETHLYPFILAAINVNKHVSCETSSREVENSSHDEETIPTKPDNDLNLQRMTNSYTLLMENPAVLRGRDFLEE